MITDILTHLLLTLEVVCTSFKDLIHRIFTFFKDVFLDGREAVGNRTQAGALDICRIITSTATIVVLTFLDTIINEQAQECCRCIQREHTLDVVINRKFQVNKINHLLMPSLV